MNVIEAIKEYQCPGCMIGPDENCLKTENGECLNHVAGSFVAPVVGWVFLGMPKGFNRNAKEVKIRIYNTLQDYGDYNFLNVPVWKYKDKNGNTFVQGLMPRLGRPFYHIFLTDCMNEINCHELTEAELNSID